jgi:hypothetical protein
LAGQTRTSSLQRHKVLPSVPPKLLVKMPPPMSGGRCPSTGRLTFGQVM